MNEVLHVGVVEGVIAAIFIIYSIEFIYLIFAVFF